MAVYKLKIEASPFLKYLQTSSSLLLAFYSLLLVSLRSAKHTQCFVYNIDKKTLIVCFDTNQPYYNLW